MISLFLSLLLAAQAPAAELNEALWDAARSGDAAKVAAILDKGADVNAKGRYGTTALFFAADKGHLEVVTLLVARGADIDVQDTFYRIRPIDMALQNGHAPVGIFLLEKGAKGGGQALMTGVRSNNAALVKAALASRDLDRRGLQSALAAAEREKRAELAAPIKAALDALPADTTPVVKLDPSIVQRYAGRYRDAASGLTVTMSVRDGQLVGEVPGQPPISFAATSETTFRAVEMDGLNIAFSGRGGLVESMTVTEPRGTTAFARLTDAAPAPATPSPAPAPAPPASVDPAPRTAPRNWPSFRGERAAGSGDGQGAVAEWDAATGKNVKWKTAIPGIATASPIVWGDRVFLTTAVSKAGDNSFRTGLYGDVKPTDDLSEHTFKVFCLDKTTGKVLWDRTAHTGPPKVKRHTKSTQANSTPATDGTRIVALFGSVGLLVAYDLSGKELWRTDLGILDSGWFFDPTYQWGHSSSPIIYRNSVIVQADVQKGSHLAAWDLTTGKMLWKTEREEIPTWGTPTLVTSQGRDELVTNGTKVRGYDPATGKLLWTLGPNSEVTVATPVAGDGVVYVTAGYPPVRPIYAIKTGASGDISLPAGQESSNAIAWSNTREGTYIPTPILYSGYLFTCGNNGVVSVYDAKTGQRVGRGRIGEGGAFSASPVAADGKLYFASEDGDVHVVRATPTLDPIAKNAMKQVIMATPAISDGLIIVRTLGHVYGIGRD